MGNDVFSAIEVANYQMVETRRGTLSLYSFVMLILQKIGVLIYVAY